MKTGNRTCIIETGWSASQSGKVSGSAWTNARAVASSMTTASGHSDTRAATAADVVRDGAAPPHAAAHTRSTDTARSAPTCGMGCPSASPNSR